MIRRGNFPPCVTVAAAFLAVLSLIPCTSGAGIPRQESAEDGPAAVPAEHAPEAAVTFDQVLPILQANCIACHNRTVAESDLSLETPEAMLKGGAMGPAIDLESPEDSLLLLLASHREEPVMPPEENDARARKLTGEELRKLTSWIGSGAKPAVAAATASLNWQPINPALNAVYALDLDWHGRFVAAGRGGHVTVYDRSRRNTPQYLVDAGLNYLVPPGQPGVAHRDFVQAVAFHPRGDEIATAGFQVVKIWRRQVASATELPCELTSDTQMLVTTRGDVLTIDAAGKLSRCAETDPLLAPEGKQISAADVLSTEPPLLIAGTQDGSLFVRREDGSHIQLPDHPANSPVRQIAAHSSEPRCAVRYEDGTISICHLTEQGDLKPATSFTQQDCRSVAWTDSDLILLCGMNRIVRRAPEAETPAAEVAVESPVQHLAVGSDSGTIACSTEAGDIEVLKAEDFSVATRLRMDSEQVRLRQFLEHRRKTADARVAHIKSLITAREKELTDQQAVTTKAIETRKAAADELTKAQEGLAGAEDALAKANEALAAAAEDADLKKAAEAAAKAVDAAKNTVAAAEKKHKIQIQDAELAQRAVERFEAAVEDLKQRLAGIEADAAAAASAVESAAQPTANPADVAGISVIQEGAVVVVCDSSGTLQLFSSDSGALLETIPGVLDGGLSDVAFAADAAVLHAGNGAVRVQPCTSNWELSATLESGPSGQPVFPERVNSLAYSPDGRLLAAGGGEASRSGVIAVWSADDHSLLHELREAHSDVVYGVAFSPDSRFLATASADKFSRVFRSDTAEPVRVLEGHTNQVMDVTWNAAQSTIATAGADHAIKIWNVDTGLQQRTISTYGKQVSSVQFADTGSALLSCSGDQRVFLHNAGDGKPMREMPRSPDYVHVAVADGSGTLIAAGCDDGHVRIWTAADGKPVADLAPATGAGN